MASKSRKSLADGVSIKKVSRGVKLADAGFAAAFFAAALYTGWWFWYASAAFCAFTSWYEPFDKLAKAIGRKGLTIKTTR
ncbi:hypothetical protein [Sphingosinicella sp. BN140058]|uniref:hypothetical protein n=1 Tax=Sphingosinicella sp. BN140058 TaxID=1892855 RepID=UPI001012F4DE|nr:hypothetical protein [Sphingosinicella sp. BN140058]QAY80145.1 hypothetical protein ETR14_26240 [Sphingosinicella sp. BN140058]